MLRFSGRLLPIDMEVVLAWGELTAALEKRGGSMPAIDSLIAATALEARLTLVMRNEDDLAHSGVTLINPWAPS